MQLLHKNIDLIERKSLPMGGLVTLKCKDFRILHLEVRGFEDFVAVAETLESLAFFENVDLTYPFFYQPQFEIVQDGWEAFCLESEFQKIKSEDWRISNVNKDFSACGTYPKLVIVPKFVTDDTLRIIAGFRYKSRFPVLSYYHKANKAVLIRTSQPMVGPNNKRCKEDEKMLNAILGPGKRGYIIDTRSQNLAQFARTKGGGFEPEAHYPLWRRVHKQIGRHSALSESLNKLVEACNDNISSTDKWLSRLESSGWLTQVKEVLTAACLVAQCINEEGASVMVHGSDGFDSTLQVSSLAQVILDPDTRTVHGFEALVEREWLQAGHPFWTRCKHSAYGGPSFKDTSPTFLLFLDCVYQIYIQFPCSFQFNEDFLVLLFKHSYASQFGTFVGDNSQERDDLRLSRRTISLWSYVNLPSVLQEYLNPTYEPNPKVIWPSVAPQSIVVWEGLYLKWILPLRRDQETKDALQKLKSYEIELKAKVMKLRKQLNEKV